MKIFRLVFLVLIFKTTTSWALKYPTQPDPQLTPGELCEKASALRYPEKISYCNRSVTAETKQLVIETYNTQLGYEITPADRLDFKIDHLIPLCMGGSNGTLNLWPQHKSVYEITDSLEFILCEKLRLAKITQKEAIEKILYAKHHLDEVSSLK